MRKKAMHIQKIIIFLLCALLVYTGIGAMNVSHLTDAYLRPNFNLNDCFEVAFMVERGISTKSYDECGCVSSPLRIWNCEQDALKMLQGFPADSKIGKLSTLINAADDGVRGHFQVGGCLDLLYNITGAARWHFSDDFIFGVYVPVRSMRLQNVVWKNLTLNLTDQDARVRTYLTDDFFANVQALGGLNLQGWKRSGLGDITFLLEWLHDFEQEKPMLKNVRLNGRLGWIIPTGLKQDEDLLFALPFGNDGAFGLLFAGGLDLTFGCYFKAGLDVQLNHYFGNSKLRRIKTDKDQTDLLLLQKVCAYKDWGLTQQFNLYAEFFQFFKGFSFRIDYQYLKHGEDVLSLDTLDFSPTIANTARSLLDWTAHSAIFKLTYDMGYDKDCSSRINPQFSLFAKAPFNGKLSTLFGTVGAIVAIDF